MGNEAENFDYEKADKETDKQEKKDARDALRDEKQATCETGGGKWTILSSITGCSCGRGSKWNKESSTCIEKTPKEKEDTGEEEEIVPEEEIKSKDSSKSSGLSNLLQGASVAAAGIGGQKIASSMAEEKADKEAEQDMKAYLSTFRCNYGSNSVKGGEKDVILPGGNDLIGLYSQYKSLAENLKQKKEALGIKSGIESEVIMDKAYTGLYDDAGTERASGTYASLSRALMDKNGEDAERIAAQKSETAKDKKTGLIVGGIGLAVGAVAPHADKIVDGLKNKNDSKEESDSSNKSDASALSNVAKSVMGNSGGDYNETTTQEEPEVIEDKAGMPSENTEFTGKLNDGFSIFGNK